MTTNTEPKKETSTQPEQTTKRLPTDEEATRDLMLAQEIIKQKIFDCFRK